MSRILVQIANPMWTKRALHLACGLAREQNHEIILLRLMQVEHISYLGSEFGNSAITHEDYLLLQEYAATAEDYGITVTLEQTQCLSPLDAIADAASLLDARIIFAHIPQSPVPFLRELRLHHLERRLRDSGCLLYTLDAPDLYEGHSTWLKRSSATSSSS